MKIIEDEVIGELRYLTVEFDQAELLAGHIGVISQGAVRRYFEGECPDLKVKKCGGLKLDSQRSIVTMRFGIVNRPNAILVRGKVPPPDNQAIVLPDDNQKPVVSDFHNREISQKLLNPGYDELKTKHDNLLLDYQIQSIEVSELKKKYDALVKAKEELHDGYDRVVEGARKDDKEFGELKERCDALVAAVMQDAQKFSDLLVENEKLRAALQSAQICYENDAYCDMSRIFERALEEDAADLGPEGELDDGTPDCRFDGTIPEEIK